MIVRVHDDRCVGHGRCYALAPDVFVPDEYGHCVVVAAELADESPLATQARAGAQSCPEQAIEVVDG